MDYDDGTASVDYQGEIRKSGTMDVSILADVATEFANSGLVALNGQEEWADGEASASMYVEYANGNTVIANFSGNIPQAFIDGYAFMDSAVSALIAEIPEYVPQAQVMGNVDATVLTEMQTIIGATSMPLDTLVISEITKDDADVFSFSTGLSSSTGIANVANCSSMMLTTAFSLVVVTAEDAANIADIRADFESNMDWGKWVCVRPTGAVIAQKDNMVICVMAADDTYVAVKGALENGGWTELTTYTDPDM
jgi:hypothetical protein